MKKSVPPFTMLLFLAGCTQPAPTNHVAAATNNAIAQQEDSKPIPPPIWDTTVASTWRPRGGWYAYATMDDGTVWPVYVYGTHFHVYVGDKIAYHQPITQCVVTDANAGDSWKFNISDCPDTGSTVRRSLVSGRYWVMLTDDGKSWKVEHGDRDLMPEAGDTLSYEPKRSLPNNNHYELDDITQGWTILSAFRLSAPFTQTSCPTETDDHYKQ